MTGAGGRQAKGPGLCVNDGSTGGRGGDLGNRGPAGKTGGNKGTLFVLVISDID